MTEVVWLLWNRALVDYAKAATTWLLIRMHRNDAEKQLSSTSHPGSDDPKRPKFDEFGRDVNSANKQY